MPFVSYPDGFLQTLEWKSGKSENLMWSLTDDRKAMLKDQSEDGTSLNKKRFPEMFRLSLIFQSETPALSSSGSWIDEEIAFICVL